MPGEVLTAKIGADKVFEIEMRDDQDGVVDGFTAAATLEANVWRGDDQEALFSPVCEWIDATAGTFRLTIARDDTDGLTEGRYRLEVKVAEDDLEWAGFDGGLQLTATPGSATPQPAYCTYEDMLRHAPWLRDLADGDEDQAGFAEQRALARKWIDTLAQQHYRGNTYGVAGYGFTLQNTWSIRRVGGIDETLQEWLDNDGLFLDPAVVEAASCYAIALVCRAQQTPTRAGKDDTYGRYTAHFYALAKSTALSLTLRIDSSDPLDGEADVWINLATADAILG